MSLLEDVFLHDEADEAQDLERIIEGDEDIPQRSDSDNDSVKGDDEAEEEKIRVDPTKDGKPKRVSKNPRFVLNPARLTGPRGIQIIPDHFKDFKFKGKGYENEDLDLILKKLEHWAYRLFPKFKFEDCLKKIETLGKKRPVMVHLHKIRSDQYLSDDPVVQKDSDDEQDQPPPLQEDEFDILLQQQIELARNTPAPDSARKHGFGTPNDVSTPMTLPKITSSPSISEEQKERIMKNRKLAEEKRLAKLRQNQTTNVQDNVSNNDDNINTNYSNIDLRNDQAINEKDLVTNDKFDEVDLTKNDKNNDNIDLTHYEGTTTRQNDKISQIDLTNVTSYDKVIINDDDTNTMIDLTNSANHKVIPNGTNIDLTAITNDKNYQMNDEIDLTDINDCRKRKSDQIYDKDDDSSSYSKKRRVNSIIDSSDDENDALIITNHIVNVDVHGINEDNRNDGKDGENVDETSSNNLNTNDKNNKAVENMIEISPINDKVMAENNSDRNNQDKNDEGLINNNKVTNSNDVIINDKIDNGSNNDIVVENNDKKSSINDKASNIDQVIDDDLQDLDFNDDM